MERELTADFETILNRLRVRNEQLDQQIEVALSSARLSRISFELMPAMLDRFEAWRVTRAKQQLALAIKDDAAQKEWERISRPSVATISHNFKGHLLRA